MSHRQTNDDVLPVLHHRPGRSLFLGADGVIPDTVDIDMDFVFIANAWSAGEENPTSKHRIARELARRGHRILWIEGSGMRTPSLGSGRDRGTIIRKIRKAAGGPMRVAGCEIRDGRPQQDGGRGAAVLDRQEQESVKRHRCCAESRSATGCTESRNSNPESIPRINVQEDGDIWVVTPLFAPFPKWGLIRRFNGWLCRGAGVRCARRIGMRQPVLVNYVPVLHDSMRGWPGMKVYHCVDRWDAFAMYDRAVMAAADEQCCRLADKVIASSRDLEVRCRRFNGNVRLVTHGVDHRLFAGALSASARPADLPEGPVVGFFGLLSEWVDQELIVSLARQIPAAHVVLIGKADVDIERLRCVPNVHLLGPRPFAALPAYVARFGVGVIPFVVSDLTRAVNPIKLREMLAAGCPVVSTRLPEVIPYAGKWVDAADSGDAFIASVRKRLACVPTDEDRRAISASVVAESWSAKVDEMLEYMATGEG